MNFLDPFCGRIFVERHPNPEVLTFHFKLKLLKRRDYISDYDNPAPNMPVLTGAITTTLREIVGVEEVSVWPYKISVVRAPLFSWDELFPAIKLAMAKYYPEKSVIG